MNPILEGCEKECEAAELVTRQLYTLSCNEAVKDLSAFFRIVKTASLMNETVR